MKAFLLVLASIVICLPPLTAAERSPAAELEAVDDARIAAVKAADATKLREIISDDLHYGHSSGGIDTKTSFIESLTSGRVKYAVYDNEERSFTFPAPGLALMHGRAHAKVERPPAAWTAKSVIWRSGGRKTAHGVSSHGKRAASSPQRPSEHGRPRGKKNDRYALFSG